MPWMEKSSAELAKDLGIDHSAVREKVRIIAEIIRVRKGKGMTQGDFGKIAGVSQARIAQIEGGVGGVHTTLDTLLRMLKLLGVEHRITFKRRAA
ncbi:MAG: helix-turn-helix transcriptional regulator [Nitrospinae bacterium]|nr:helix-turn-helix transcriptional regulator [Nitrospinota bacterium]